MSDTSREFREADIDITQAEGPDIEAGDDLQAQLGTPEHPGTEADDGSLEGPDVETRTATHETESAGGTEGLTATEAAAGPDDDTVRSN